MNQVTALFIKLGGAGKNFSAYLLGGLGALTLLTSFFDVDHRGMLFADGQVFAFADEIDQAGVYSYPVIWGAGRGGPVDERGARRLIPARGGQAGPLTGTGSPDGTGGGGGAGPVTLADAGTALVPGGLNTPDAGNAGGGNGGRGGFPGFNSSISSPVGGFVITPGDGDGGTDGGDNGVVPSVPEPASWLLMILGIGALGIALRRQAAQKTAYAHSA
ncbi:hypothetical protein FHS61_000577 [Altererythrobacter atlanticus]|uniref:PEP-CTERM motif protein n=1 Tax=Croceibacterium atlanticum TaxID=1267766 RepID=A0A0F7KT80_9SPHN|nr:PEPxxWA-CTERM sorting domain-containing protein [Croceibacterium atlanticum]AKH42804.1 PEP-CTERM motif protein [Croceibacterium atlanticum]MBB5731584.1 hypothetical protein [Croceibacterium atlanticum]